MTTDELTKLFYDVSNKCGLKVRVNICTDKNLVDANSKSLYHSKYLLAYDPTIQENEQKHIKHLDEINFYLNFKGSDDDYFKIINQYQDILLTYFIDCDGVGDQKIKVVYQNKIKYKTTEEGILYSDNMDKIVETIQKVRNEYNKMYSERNNEVQKYEEIYKVQKIDEMITGKKPVDDDDFFNRLANV